MIYLFEVRCRYYEGIGAYALNPITYLLGELPDGSILERCWIYKYYRNECSTLWVDRVRRPDISNVRRAISVNELSFEVSLTEAIKKAKDCRSNAYYVILQPKTLVPKSTTAWTLEEIRNE